MLKEWFEIKDLWQEFETDQKSLSDYQLGKMFNFFEEKAQDIEAEINSRAGTPYVGRTGKENNE